MGKKSLLEALGEGKVLVSDGAWGTALQQRGLKPGECPEALNETMPLSVACIAKGYLDAGADMCLTNTFGGNAPRLSHFNMADKLELFNELGAICSKSVCPPDKWVLGSMGPTGKMLLTEEITEDELYDSFSRQAKALAKGGADALCVETMMDGEEACIAVRAAKENTSLTVICTFTFEKVKTGGYKTIFGLTPTQACQMALEAGADIIGTNCGNGMAQMAPIVEEIRAALPAAFILVHANAGVPIVENGELKFFDTPEKMRDEVVDVLNAGANIVGGCCGTTPLHIKAIREAVDEFNRKMR